MGSQSGGGPEEATAEVKRRTPDERQARLTDLIAAAEAVLTATLQSKKADARRRLEEAVRRMNEVM